jgi:UDP-N-acetylglucosamine--N-acetylmuramyl-(pentapeptide) pyrophosphoryl-undecaprenol N-acetylglucosamine transferase
MRTEPEGARQYLALEPDIPTILVLGGSQGASKINESILSALPDLVAFINIIHQTGVANLKEVQNVAGVELKDNPHESRYHPFGYLDEVSLQRAAGAANLIVSRAGAGSIAEIGLWKKPAILIPIPESISHDQRINAYSYARTGAAVVIEEENLVPHILVSEIRRITSDPGLVKTMATSAEGFTDPDAARILANQLLAIALEHAS